MTSHKPEFCLDSNMVGILYMYLKEGRASFEKYPTLDTMSLSLLEYFCKHYKDYSLYITPQVFREIEYGMSLLDNSYSDFKKDYFKFIKSTFIPIIPFGYKNVDDLSHAVNQVKEKYLEENIPLSDRTRALQSAIAYESKNYSIYDEMKKTRSDYNSEVFEEELAENGNIKYRNFGDAILVTENNMFRGIPILTLNEKHLVKIANCSHKLRQKNLRSYFILKKNKEIIESDMIDHKKIIANLKRKNSTTISIKNLFDFIK